MDDIRSGAGLEGGAILEQCAETCCASCSDLIQDALDTALVTTATEYLAP